MSASEQPSFIFELEKIIEERKTANPETSYTASLIQRGPDKVLQKVGEEAVEYILEAKNQDKERAISEGADLMYHFLISLSMNDLSLVDIEQELIKRHNK